ncbi:MAG TPA: hypothetical protein VGI45_25200 [Terracidiphilus sp.]|jgi:hypothetical protein
MPVASFVVKNGSNNFLRVSALIPLPVSPTVMMTPLRRVIQSFRVRIRRRNVPPWGMASNAFLTTLSMTWRSSSRWQLIIGNGSIVSPYGDAHGLDRVVIQDNRFIQNVRHRTQSRLTPETINS